MRSSNGRTTSNTAPPASRLRALIAIALRLEDYALLAGTVGLFLVLSAVMYVTRRMDWYELRLGSREPL